MFGVTSSMASVDPVIRVDGPLAMCRGLSPVEAIRSWPDDVALAAVVADGTRWSRWTIPGRPSGRVVRVGTEFATELNGPGTGAVGTDRPPFVGGWLGYVGYEFGRMIEPAAGAGAGARDDRGWPTGLMLRCDDAWAHDGKTGAWWRIGDPPRLNARPRSDFRVGAMRSRTGREQYCRDAARVIEYIRAGDIFQANLSHRLSGRFTGSARALLAQLVETARPRHGAYVELPVDKDGVARAIVSMSPELFLDFDPGTRRVTTRPMKGTSEASADPMELARSVKDRAELNMIVDLMRNDLGRVCAFGSVRVEQSRTLERHGGGSNGVHQGVATVSGRLRDGVGIGALIGSTFAPGSVTGAPKIRAMQIIEQLEPVARGPYCGAVGFVSDSGHAKFNVAIRTAAITGEPTRPGPVGFENAQLDYGVGAAIVADSDAKAEWRETIVKAGILRDVAESVEGA